MVRVAGFEPTASWTRRELEHFFQCFLLAFGRFRSDSLTLRPSLNAGFPCAPGLYVVGSVVKTLSALCRDPAGTGSVLSVSDCLHCTSECRLKQEAKQKEDFCRL